MSPPTPENARYRKSQDLARLLAAPEGLRLARLLQDRGLLKGFLEDLPERLPPFAGDPTKPRKPSTQKIKRPRPISIWEPRYDKDHLVFRRPETHPLGDHFAATPQFETRKPQGIRRICFFGESVAAGYLYAPHLTPAQVLANHLREVAGPGFEVIDLARTNERLDPLVATVEASLQLAPDLVVIFAGNNWTLLETPEVSPYLPGVRSRQRYAHALRDGGVAGPIETAGLRLLERTRNALARIGEITAAAGIPVLLVIPEVNLADWEDRQPVTWLPGDQSGTWHRLYHRAQTALRAANWTEVLQNAHRMLAMDNGTCPTTFRLLARAYLGKEDPKRAAEACRAEVDSSHYATLCFLGAPRATSMARELQRRMAALHGFTSVDLPEIFADYTGSPLPGRRLFLDYCHLTSEGIHVAMAAVAAAALGQFGNQDDVTDWRNLLERLPVPKIPDHVEATAQFGAAIHGAHRLVSVSPKRDILAYWCDRALTTSPGVADAMLDFVAARSAPCPAVLTAAQQRNFSSPYRLQLQHGWQFDYLDVSVIEAIEQTLSTRDPEATTTILKRLSAYHAITEECRECWPFFLWEPLERFYPEVMAFADMNGRATLRAPWPDTSFCIIAKAPANVRLDLTARLPRHAKGPAPLGLSINGKALANVTLSERWQTRRIAIAGKDIKRGINRLTLHWPPLTTRGDEALQAAITRLEQGIEADIHPIFGELFSLRAHLA